MSWKPTTEAVKRRALHNMTAYRKAVQVIQQKNVAELIEVAPSSLSDFNDALERACLVFAAAGLQLVDHRAKVLDVEEYRFYLRQQARHAERELAALETQSGDLT